jgi:hypothetical protein
LQTVFLRNDDEVYKLLNDKNGWLTQLAGSAEKPRAKENADADAKQLAGAMKRLEARIAKLKKDDKDKEAKAAGKELAELKKKAGKLEDARREAKQKESKPSPALDHEELVVEAYLRTVGRLPNERELNAAIGYLAESSDTIAGMRDLLWALLNTKEFIVNR